MSSSPRYYLQTTDGQLSGYYNLSLLLLDSGIHSHLVKELFESDHHMGITCYVPVTREKLVERAKQEAENNAKFNQAKHDKESDPDRYGTETREDADCYSDDEEETEES